MKLKEITFMFENKDSVTIDGKYVESFLVDGINMDEDDFTNEGKEIYISLHNNLYAFISNKSELEYYFGSNVIDADS